MKFVFWQNIISIHQSAFIKALAENHEVVLAVEQDLDGERKEEKWNLPEMGDAKIIIAPSEEVIDKLILQNDTQHVFSGIDAYPMVYKVFKKAVKKRLPISVLAEPYNFDGVKGRLRRLKYSFYALKYGKHICHFFATGFLGIESYLKAGFHESKLPHWGYFTEQPAVEKLTNSGKEKLPALIFIGKLDRRKNILSLIKAAQSCTQLFERFTIIGAGEYEQLVKQIVVSEPKFEYLGIVDNKEINKYLVTHDLLVLPSLFDGWGAVVNEALYAGARVLCSNKCGASTLLDGQKRGGVFNLGNKNDLFDKLNYWLRQGKISNKERNEISNWVKTHVSGEVAADYFVKVINGEKIEAPWIEN